MTWQNLLSTPVRATLPGLGGKRTGATAHPLGSVDLFYGAYTYDPQPDWVDLDKVAIPQADEQQRLLANLIIQITSTKNPCPGSGISRDLSKQW